MGIHLPRAVAPKSLMVAINAITVRTLEIGPCSGMGNHNENCGTSVYLSTIRSFQGKRRLKNGVQISSGGNIYMLAILLISCQINVDLTDRLTCFCT